MCKWVWVWVWVCAQEGRCPWWPELLGPLELGFQVVVSCQTWVLGIKLRFSARI